jgi:hypothetical protein
MANTIRIWDGKTAINGVEAEEILANRRDLRNALGDIFLVENEYGRVFEIQIGNIIATNYGINPNLGLLDIARKYMKIKEEERISQEEANLTTEQMQEELALLSYEVMSLRPEVSVMTTSVSEKRSPKFSSINVWYKRGYWTKEMVRTAVEKGTLTEEEYEEIIGQK